MKKLHLIILFFSIASFSQNGEIKGRIALTNVEIKFENINLLLIRNDSVIAYGHVSKKGEFIFKNLSNNLYTLRIQQIGFRDKNIDNVEIDTALKIPYPGTCEYPLMTTPRCEKGHTYDIIPIVYGLPGKKIKRQAEKGKIRLGGCEVTNCDPHYYCKIHDVEF